MKNIFLQVADNVRNNISKVLYDKFRPKVNSNFFNETHKNIRIRGIRFNKINVNNGKYKK